MNRTGAYFAALAAVAALLLGGGCAVHEINGPTTVHPMADAGPGEHAYVTVSRRAGVTQGFELIRPARVKASVILFAGGGGAIGVSADGIRYATNFLVRSREDFALHDLMVAVVDTPSDRQKLYNFRTSEAHAIDIKGVIAFLRKQADTPVWLVGTSRGTVSAASVAARLKQGGPDGLVLTSSVLKMSRRLAPSVFNVALDEIRIPTLVVHHRDDACAITPYSAVHDLMAHLTAAPEKALITVQGGGTPRGDPCEPFHKHGYIGQEADVVARIANWIEAHPPHRP